MSSISKKGDKNDENRSVKTMACNTMNNVFEPKLLTKDSDIDKLYIV